MEKIWPRVLEIIREDVSEQSFNQWFGTIEAVRLHDSVVYITLPNLHAYDYMEQIFRQMIEAALADAAGRQLAVKFQISGDTFFPEESKKPSVTAIPGFPDPAKKGESTDFNPRYTFDSYVVGNSNRFAHAAAMAVAERPSRTYNPLFIYGGSGLGKTHLMHAIAQSVLQKKPSAKVVYVSTEKFTNEFISLVRTGKAFAFKNRYRNADIFLIDDIQFITGKTGTQEEFFHTFNALHDAGRQIVISSDRPSRDIEKLEERLRSRFEWGLTTDIQSPDFETRCAILQRKADMEQIVIPDEAIFYMAERINSNIRELEGALNRLACYIRLNNLDSITLEKTIEELAEMLPPVTKPQLSVESIQRAVAALFKVRAEDFKTKKRHREIAYPRQVAMYLCREMLNIPLERIGQEFGGRDHTTVMHACDKIKEERKNSDYLAGVLEDLTKKLN
ncbi:MAG: chromosomal replication initiator protein DnaA [Clostridiales bacterium]|nr:chromosomal replication initiator protein DnaA [Clostridiales bacterium]